MKYDRMSIIGCFVDYCIAKDMSPDEISKELQCFLKIFILKENKVYKVNLAKKTL